MNGNLARYCKFFEQSTNSQILVPGLPIYVRLDGRAFHTFTKDMNKPFDDRMISAMRYVAYELVNEWDCKLAYVQSDEISLVFDDYTELEAFPFFNGRFSKLTSVLASSCTAKFADSTYSWRMHRDRWDDSALIPCPQFDCRVWQAPKEYLPKYLIWRQDDAIRNSINMMAHAYLPTELRTANSLIKKAHLRDIGHDWYSLNPYRQRGSFFGKKNFVRRFSAEEISKLPWNHDARKNPNLEVSRRETSELYWPPVRSIQNIQEVVFDDAKLIQENA